MLNNPYDIDFLDSIKTKGGGTLFRNMTGGQKEQRQIFIVSHSVGAIEDEEIRKDIIDILEGGRYTLQLRMKKLRISNGGVI